MASWMRHLDQVGQHRRLREHPETLEQPGVDLRFGQGSFEGSKRGGRRWK
jgi:hypothetical protein